MKTIVTFLLGAAVVLAWAPWVDSAYVFKQLEIASNRARASINSTEQCAFSDVISSKRLPFGYQNEVKYLCGTSEEAFKRNVFVTSAGNVLMLSKLVKVATEE